MPWRLSCWPWQAENLLAAAAWFYQMTFL
jgi:hypothetical protein